MASSIVTLGETRAACSGNLRADALCPIPIEVALQRDRGDARADDGERRLEVGRSDVADVFLPRGSDGGGVAELADGDKGGLGGKLLEVGARVPVAPTRATARAFQALRARDAPNDIKPHPWVRLTSRSMSRAP